MSAQLAQHFKRASPSTEGGIGNVCGLSRPALFGGRLGGDSGGPGAARICRRSR